jgi:4'-phosphopantetheinyl transferase EntD
MIGGILPDGVVAVEAFDDSVPVRLFPAEEDVIRRAVEKRRREFATARRCAREALAVLGYPAAPLLPGERGAPVWPVGVVGSIAHCAGYRTAVVARADQMWTVGVDAEPDEPLPADVLPAIALPQEMAHLERLRGVQRDVHWDRLLFSAKESVYKAWFPLTRRWLDFQDAVIEMSPSTGRFEARLLVTAKPGGRALAGFSGRFLAAGNLLITAIAVPQVADL